MSCVGDSCGVGGWGGPKPGDPSTDGALQARGVPGGVQLSWTLPSTNAFTVAHTVVYRSTSNQFINAIPISTWGGTDYFDRVAHGVQYWYWIQFVSINGTILEPIGPATAVAQDSVAQMILDISGMIDRGVLAQALRTEIDRIQPIGDEIKKEIQDRLASNTALMDFMRALEGDVTQVMSFIQDETTQRQEGDATLLEHVNTLAIGQGDNLALITEEKNLRIRADEALAEKVDLTYSQTQNDISAAVLNVTTAFTNADSALASDVASLYATKAGMNAAIQSEATARANAVESLSRTVDTVEAMAYDAAAAAKADSMVPTIDSTNWGGANLLTNVAGPVGNVVRRSTGNINVLEFGGFLPIDRTRVYRARFYARAAAGTNGRLYHCLRQFSSANGSIANLQNGGRINYDPSYQAPHTEWRPYESIWQSDHWEAAATYFHPDLLLNYEGTTGYWEIQDYKLQDITEFITAKAAVESERIARIAAHEILAGRIDTIEANGPGDEIAQAEERLEAKIGLVDGKVVEIGALHTVKLNVNGLIGGFGTYNDGNTVQTGFDVDSFWIGRDSDLVKPFMVYDGRVYINSAYIADLNVDRIRSGAMNAEWRLTGANARIVMDNGTVMKVQGNGFGANGNLLTWFGPSMAISQCSTGNAINYETTSGDAYWGGSLRAGVLYNAQQTTSVAFNASVPLGPFWSNGNPKSIVVSYTYTYFLQNRNLGSTGYTATGESYAVVQLWRGDTYITERRFDGNSFVSNEFDGPDTASVEISGSFTYTDTGGAGNYEYRAVIVSRVQANLVHGSGSSTSSNTRQTLGLVSTEQ